MVVHRRAHFDSDDDDVVRRDELAMLSIERCLIDTWQLRSPERRRAELITAVRGRRTSVERVRAELAGVAIPDRAELEQLLELLAAGCASELEIWRHGAVSSRPQHRWSGRGCPGPSVLRLTGLGR